jgi:hypothetical protein
VQGDENPRYVLRHRPDEEARRQSLRALYGGERAEFVRLHTFEDAKVTTAHWRARFRRLGLFPVVNSLLYELFLMHTAIFIGYELFWNSSRAY